MSQQLEQPELPLPLPRRPSTQQAGFDNDYSLAYNRCVYEYYEAQLKLLEYQRVRDRRSGVTPVDPFTASEPVLDKESLLGRTVRDLITGFCGVATGVCEYITGCKQALVSPSVGADGSHRESQWFDVDRLFVTAEKALSLAVENAGPDKPAPKR